MLQDHTTARAMSSRYAVSRPRGRRDKVGRPSARRARSMGRIVPRPVESS